MYVIGDLQLDLPRAFWQMSGQLLLLTTLGFDLRQHPKVALAEGKGAPRCTAAQ